MVRGGTPAVPVGAGFGGGGGGGGRYAIREFYQKSARRSRAVSARPLYRPSGLTPHMWHRIFSDPGWAQAAISLAALLISIATLISVWVAPALARRAARTSTLPILEYTPQHHPKDGWLTIFLEVENPGNERMILAEVKVPTRGPARIRRTPLHRIGAVAYGGIDEDPQMSEAVTNFRVDLPINAKEKTHYRLLVFFGSARGSAAPSCRITAVFHSSSNTTRLIIRHITISNPRSMRR